MSTTTVINPDGSTSVTTNGVTITYAAGTPVPGASSDPLNPNGPPTGGGTGGTGGTDSSAGSFKWGSTKHTDIEWKNAWNTFTPAQKNQVKTALINSGYFDKNIPTSTIAVAWGLMVDWATQESNVDPKWNLKDHLSSAAGGAVALSPNAYSIFGAALKSPSAPVSTTGNYQTKEDAIVQLRQFAYDNGIVISEKQMQSYGHQIGFNENSKAQTLANIEQNLRDKVIAPKYKAFADDIKAGHNVRDLAHDYIQMISQTLEIDPNKIDLAKDPLLSKALLGYAGDKGATVYPNYTDFQTMVHQDPRWQYTENAHQTMTDVAAKIQNAFGF